MNDAERKIRAYLNASAGNGNHPSDHTLHCFCGMVETGEVTIEDLRRIGGEWLVDRVREIANKYGVTI